MSTTVRVDRVVIEGSWTGPSDALRSAIAAELRSGVAGLRGTLDRDAAAALVTRAASAPLESGRRS